MRIVTRSDGTRVAEECVCRITRRAERMVAQARIPERYRHCTLDDFVPSYAGKNNSLESALVQARNFVKAYPVETNGKGLLLLGSVGLGKTHLAVGILQALIAERGAKGLFCDYRDLLKQIQDSYGRNDVSERQVLAPVFDAEVLVIDELGAAKPTEWVWDTVQHILNTRYKRPQDHDHHDELSQRSGDARGHMGPLAGRQAQRTGGHAPRHAGRSHHGAHAFAAAGNVRGGGDAGRGFPLDSWARELCVGLRFGFRISV